MKRLNLGFYLALFSLLISCGKADIVGELEIDAEYGDKVYLLNAKNFEDIFSPFKGSVLGEAIIDSKGHFEFKNLDSDHRDKLYFLSVQKKEQEHANFLENDFPEQANYIPIVHKKGEQIKIKSHINAFLKQAEISGSNTINQEILNLAKTRESLFDTYIRDLKLPDEEDLLEYEKSIWNFQHELIDSVKDVDNIFTPILALRWAATDGFYERITEEAKATCEKVQTLNSTHIYSQQLCDLGQKLPLSIGELFPDYDLPLLDETIVSLQELLGEKLTILDLWAAWCAPCRVENRETLVPLWNQYQEQGLQIIGYSIDGDKETWEAAIQRDGADLWTHASHLQDDDSPFFKQLNITTIPANYILDANGKILAKNLHGEELIQWIAKYFDEK